MNGARSLLNGLLGAGVDVCFANPGTSEMHFVAALDAVPQMRAVLGLYEGVVTGAADGYGRMAGKPAATLLHLGPGLGNGLANLHNARRANTPVVNVVGDHATYHRALDAPLASDIPAIAGAVSVWTRDCTRTADVAADAADAVAAATGAPHGVATLILPADASWSDGGTEPVPVPASGRAPAGADELAAVADALRGDGRTALLLGGPALGAEPLRAASRIAAATGAAVLAECFPTRLARGAGLPAVERLAYLGERAAAQLREFDHLVLVGAPHPVSFFAYPGKPSDLVAEGCTVHTLADRSQSADEALAELARLVAGSAEPERVEPHRPALPTGELTGQALTDVIGALLPEDAIVSDEGNTSSATLPASTAGCPPHDLLTLTGGAIGQGMAVAVGAAVACPDRPVLCLEADGSAMYGPSALWTMAREQLDVTVVVVNNGAYAILRMELGRVGTEGDAARARRLFDLSGPDLDFVALATSMGVPARRARTAEELADALRAAFAEPGPHLVDAVVPPLA